MTYQTTMSYINTMDVCSRVNKQFFNIIIYELGKRDIHDVSENIIFLISHLTDCEKPISINDFMARSGSMLTNLTYLLRQAERREYIKANMHPCDKRIRLLSLTEKGITVATEIQQIIENIINPLIHTVNVSIKDVYTYTKKIEDAYKKHASSAHEKEPI